jgi:hypothetical protein
MGPGSSRDDGKSHSKSKSPVAPFFKGGKAESKAAAMLIFFPL